MVQIYFTLAKPLRIVDDCCGIGTASTALQMALKRDDFTIAKVEASESDDCVRQWIKIHISMAAPIGEERSQPRVAGELLWR